MNPIADLRAELRRIQRDPKAYLRFYTICGYLAVFPHPQNNDFRKLLTGVYTLIWVAASIDVIQVARQPFLAMTLVLGTIIGVQYGLTIARFGPVEFELNDDE